MTNVVLQFTTDLDCLHDQVFDSHFTVRISRSCLRIASAATTTLLTTTTTAYAAATTYLVGRNARNGPGQKTL